MFFSPNFCKERHFPREITKAFSAPSLIVIELLSCAKYNAGHAKDQILLGFCKLLHYFSQSDLVAAGQSPVIESSIIAILPQLSLQQAFPLLQFMCNADV